MGQTEGNVSYIVLGLRVFPDFRSLKGFRGLRF